MGIESDQVVYEYLSRVGDVAQQRQLPSATRMRLVSELRNEIDRRRAKAVVDSPAAVRGILERLGSPDDIVAAAGGAVSPYGGPGVPPAPAVPVQRDPGAAEDASRAARAARRSKGERAGRPAPPAPPPGEGPSAADTGAARERPTGLRRIVPRPRPAKPPASPPPAGGALPPHLATADELGDGTAGYDWLRSAGGGDPFGVGDDVPGFVGGVEIPDLLKPPPAKAPVRRPDSAPAPTAAAVAAADLAAADPPPRVRRRLVVLPRRSGGWSNPLLLLAAGLLVVGAVLGNWFALLLGWAIAYGSRRLTRAESKWAVAGLPGLAVAAGLLWLWGRDDGRWGDPVAQGHMKDAIVQTWPWVVRAAAALSALFLVWRSQRQRPE
ncbi:hypothetical protein [Streptomyces sp. NPDC046985]|uniref:hypothetical protein n=1 Tax=Streptomyces sp. NPDC046985 TaxID=3155377 RepID=UPI0033C49EA8